MAVWYPARNRHKKGDWLAVDDESGLTYYASEMVRRWDGALVHRKSYETRQPQEFVKARNDPRPLRNIRPDDIAPKPFNAGGAFIGNTNIHRPTNGPGASISDPPIGEMVVGSSFFVRITTESGQ